MDLRKFSASHKGTWVLLAGLIGSIVPFQKLDRMINSYFTPMRSSSGRFAAGMISIRVNSAKNSASSGVNGSLSIFRNEWARVGPLIRYKRNEGAFYPTFFFLEASS